MFRVSIILDAREEILSDREPTSRVAWTLRVADRLARRLAFGRFNGNSRFNVAFSRLGILAQDDDGKPDLGLSDAINREFRKSVRHWTRDRIRRLTLSRGIHLSPRASNALAILAVGRACDSLPRFSSR